MTVRSAITLPTRSIRRDREVGLRDPLLNEVADHYEHDQIEGLERRELAAADRAREKQDEEEADGGADDEIHRYG